MESQVFNPPNLKANPAISFPGFAYTATALKRFSEAAGVYSILLKSDQVVHFEPGDPIAFKQWLRFFKVPDISSYYL